MNNPQNNGPFPDPQLADVAAEWYARNDRGLSEDEAAEFARWCDLDPEHAAAYAEVERTWALLRPLTQLRTAGVPDADLLRPATETTPQGRIVRPARTTWWPWLAAAAAIALLLAFWPGLGRGTASAAVHAYESPVGGRERVTLQDGSLLELNTGARVEVSFTRAERRIRLTRGEVLFTVAKDAARPFVVTDDRVAVRAIGTAFDVRRRESSLDVWVTEGRVSIVPVTTALGGLGTASLGVGERAVVEGDGEHTPRMRLSRVTQEEMDRLLAWQRGMLEFRETPLRDVLEEMSRYHSVVLRAADTATASIAVGGSFRSDNLEAFLRVLDLSFGVTVESQTADTIVLRRTREP